MAMNIIFPDGTTTAELKANLNVKTSAPATSEGPGEMIYRSDESKVYVNTGTAGSPVWTDISGSGGTDHGELIGLTDDDHTQYYNSARHTKAIHDALSIDADTLDTLHASAFALTGHTHTLINNALDLGTNKITNLASAVADTDAANLGDVKSVSGELPIDSVSLPLSESSGTLGINWDSTLALSGNNLVVNQANLTHNSIGGRSTADSHPQSAITGLVTALAGKLPLAGGTLTGQLNFNSINDYVTQYVSGENTGLELNGNYYGVQLKAGGSLKMQVGTSGVYLSDDINMQTNMVKNLGTASDDGDAVSKEYAEDYFLRRNGGSTYAMVGDLYTGGYGVVFETGGTPDNWIVTTTPVSDTILQIMGEDEVDICVGGSAGSPALTATTSAVTVVKRLYIGNSDTYLERSTSSPYNLKIVCNGIEFDTA